MEGHYSQDYKTALQVAKGNERTKQKLRKGMLKDPFDLFHGVIDAYQIDFSKAEEHYSDSKPEFDGYAFYTMTFKNENQDPKKGLEIALYLRDPKTGMYYNNFKETGLTPVPEELAYFILGKGKIKDKKLRDIHLDTCSIDDFGEFKKFIEINVNYDQNSHLCDKPDGNYAALWVDIAQGKNNLFELINLTWDYIGNYNKGDHADCPIYPEFKDILELTQTDFRPYVHRFFEVFSGTSKEVWHDPGIYTGRNTQSSSQPLDIIVSSTIEALFTGVERVQLEAQLADARLKMRNGYASVPRLFLGNIVMPTPGQKDINSDGFVLNAAPLLIEYLHTLGIMSPEQAEEVVSRKLENYFVHRAGFQLSRDRAIQVVSQLKPSQIDYQQQEVA